VQIFLCAAANCSASPADYVPTASGVNGYDAGNRYGYRSGINIHRLVDCPGARSVAAKKMIVLEPAS
jgi:hypothetical protein